MTESMDLAHTAATVIARARDTRGMTAPEFDLRIKLEGVGGPLGWLGQEAYRIAAEQLPTNIPTAEREAAGARLWNQLQPEMEAYAKKCRDRQYANWSTAAQARGKRIQYAD